MTSYREALIKTMPTINKHVRGREQEINLLCKTETARQKSFMQEREGGRESDRQTEKRRER